MDQIQDRIKEDCARTGDEKGDDHAEKKSGEDFLAVFFSVTASVELTEDYRDPSAEAVEDEDKKVHKTAGYSHRGKGIGAKKSAHDQ